jgi:hypothetical protein
VRFEVFDRDAAAPTVPDGPVVRVDSVWLLFNRPVWDFLSAHTRMQKTVEVALGFDVETRTVSVEPLADPQSRPPGVRCEVRQRRSRTWPVGVDGRRFFEVYLIAAGQYPARLWPGPGPRMVTLAVGGPHRPGPVVPAQGQEGWARP